MLLLAVAAVGVVVDVGDDVGWQFAEGDAGWKFAEDDVECDVEDDDEHDLQTAVADGHH